MKKTLSIFLVLLLIFCSLPFMRTNAEDAVNNKFTVTSTKVGTTSISGDDVNGYTIKVAGMYLTRVMTMETYPMKNLSFDFGYQRTDLGMGYGEFGITISDDIDSVPIETTSDTLTFRYSAAGGTNNNQLLNIYVVWENNTQRLIGSFDYATYRPGDDYRNTNISNFQFVLDENGNLRLAVDGNLCTISDYSNLNYLFDINNFINNEKVHIFVGGYHASGTGTAYFKQLSSLNKDGAWESRAVDSYIYKNSNEQIFEQRCGGNTSLTEHSAIPAKAEAASGDGYMVDFTGTNGYAQTAEGFDLKTTRFKVTPITYSGDNSNLWYYLGFTANPAEFQYHSNKPSDTVEFRFAGSAGKTYGWLTKSSVIKSSELTLGSLFNHDARCYDGGDYVANPLVLSFVQDTGADKELHWYMKVSVSGNERIIKADNADDDLYCQFDSLIDVPVYFRMGTDTMKSNIFKMYCSIDDGSNPFYVNDGKEESTVITGDNVNGYTIEVTGTGLTRVMTRKTYPMKNLSFDFGYQRTDLGLGYGEFGITTSDDIDTAPAETDKNTLTFRYYAASGANNKQLLNIYVVWENNTPKLIGSFDYATYRPGDEYRNTNISNFQFVLDKEGHLRLAVDGNLCTNSDYSKLNIMFDTNNFINNKKVHIFVGGYHASGTGTAYFKQLSSLNKDGAWESRAVDSYIYKDSNEQIYEQRCGGNTSLTAHSAIPAKAEATSGDGYIVDFTGTNGYAQTTDGFDLRTTIFKVTPITYSGDSNNLWYYLGFTVNPSEFQYHSNKPSDTVEFRFAGSAGKTYGWLTKSSVITSSELTLGSLFDYDARCYVGEVYDENPLSITFVQDRGADGKLHWYMKISVSGNDRTIKADNADDDLYYQFDSLIDVPVYLRIGTDTMKSNTFKMYCDIDGDVITDSPLYSNITFEDYLINSEDGVVIDDDVVYAYCDTINEVGEYVLEYNDSSMRCIRKLILYKESDVNADNAIDVRDLVALKTRIAGNRKLDIVGTKAADLNDDGMLDTLDLAGVKRDLVEGIGFAEQIPDASGPIETILYVKDFGAVGDGQTDDGKAISDAMSALVMAGNNSKLVFEADKTYYYNDNGAISNSKVFELEDAVNVHIEGDNTTIVTEAPRGYVDFSDTVGCSISGFNFDYGKRPYFMANNATEIDTAAGTCVMEVGEGMAKKYLGLTTIGESVDVSDQNGGMVAGFIESEKTRYHMYLSKYELVDTDKIKIYFITSKSQYLAGWMKMLDTYRLICPTPGVGYNIEHATHFSGNRDLTMKNINIYSACKFVMGLSCSEGTITFDNVDLIPNPALEGTFEATDFVSFRDGWHCKENRAKIIWRNCDASGNYDDIVNLSSSVMWVKEVQAANRINMYWNETGGVFRAELKKGDELTIIDTSTGEILAETTVERVVRQSGSDNVVILSDSFAEMMSGENIQVLFENLVAPDSIMENCNFNGTWRFRGPITITNCEFYCRRMWLDVYVGTGWIEGPVPKDILFKNCKFTFDNTYGEYVHANVFNDNVSATSYHIKNVVFEDCVINESHFDIGTGDEVIFKNCTNESNLGD